MFVFIGVSAQRKKEAEKNAIKSLDLNIKTIHFSIEFSSPWRSKPSKEVNIELQLSIYADTQTQIHMNRAIQLKTLAIVHCVILTEKKYSSMASISFSCLLKASIRELA